MNVELSSTDLCVLVVVDLLCLAAPRPSSSAAKSLESFSCGSALPCNSRGSCSTGNAKKVVLRRFGDLGGTEGPISLLFFLLRHMMKIATIAERPTIAPMTLPAIAPGESPVFTLVT